MRVTMARHNIPRYRRSVWRLFGRLAIGTCVLAAVLGIGAWLSMKFLVSSEVTSPETILGGREASFFQFSVTVKADHVRVDGTADFPNGVILVGTLNRVGSGQVEIKEALVMNRLFALEFGPELLVEYYLHGPRNALQAGVYSISVDFDQAQQSPFAKESLLRWPLFQSSAVPGASSTGGLDPAMIRVSKVLTIGTLEEQREVQVWEQEYRQLVRQQLHATAGALADLWQQMRAHYQEERLKGSFTEGDTRASEWQAWEERLTNDLKAIGQKAQLNAEVSSASPLLSARDALASAHKQLGLLNDFYAEVLTNERLATDRDLQKTEHIIQYAFADVGAQLGYSYTLPPSPKAAEDAKATVIISAPLVNIRSGPGMGNEAIRQAKKDEVFDLLGEQGEWFHIRLNTTLAGWVHRNVASKHSQGGGIATGPRSSDTPIMTSEHKPRLSLEPINLFATPAEYIPQPTADEIKIYGEMEAQLRATKVRGSNEPQATEQQVLQRTSEQFGVSLERVRNSYLKVQGWEIAH